MKSPKKRIIIVDLDGTLTNLEHRVHHVEKKVKDWDAFYSGVGLDKLNTWCGELIEGMRAIGIEALLLTGRSDGYRFETEKWLEAHKVPYHKLLMREASDRRDDYEVKREIFLEKIEPNYETLFVVEDRLSVVKMWRELNITCLQCDWGEF